MNEQAILRAFHVVAGAFWVGATFLNAFFLMPAVMASGPAGGQVMRVLVQVRRLPLMMNLVMAVTLISGLWLFGRDSAGFGWPWITSSMGFTLTIGAVCALATAAIGHFVAVPSVKRLGALAAASAGGPPSPEQAAEIGLLQRRLVGAARVGSILLILATIAMAVARYI